MVVKSAGISWCDLRLPGGSKDLYHFVALTFLSEILPSLQVKPDGVGPTLRDAALKEQTTQIRDKYVVVVVVLAFVKLLSVLPILTDNFSY